MGRTTTQGIGRTEAAGGPAERAAAAGAADLGQWCAAGPRNLSLSVELGRAMLEMHRQSSHMRSVTRRLPRNICQKSSLPVHLHFITVQAIRTCVERTHIRQHDPLARTTFVLKL